MKLKILTLAILSAYQPIVFSKDMVVANNNVIAKNDMVIANNERIASARLAALNTAYIEDLALIGNTNGADSAFSKALSFHKKEITIHVIGEDKTLQVTAQVSLNSVIIPTSAKLSRYFSDLGLSKEKTLKIERQLEAGITSTPCEGSRSDCIITTQKLAFVNDYYNNTLRIFIPLDYYSQLSKEKEYLKPTSQNLLTSRWNANISEYDDFSYFVNNTSRLGLGDGFVSTQFYSSKNDSLLNDAYYRWYNTDISQSVGLSSYTGDLNTAASLSILGSTSFIGYTVGNSYKLELKKQSDQFLYFLAPSDGLLIIKREGNVILQRNVSAGRGKISYNELPSGTYNISVEVQKDKHSIYNNKLLIVNTPDDGYLSNSWFFRTGYLADNGLFAENNKYKSMIEFGINSPFLNYFNLFANGVFTPDTSVGRIGIGYQGDSWRTQTSFNGNVDSYYYEVEASSGNLNLNFKKYYSSLTEKENSKIFIYDQLDSKNGWEANAGYNFTIFDKYIFSSNFYYNEAKSDEYSYKNYGLNSTLSYSFTNGISVSLQQQLTNSENNWGISLNIPFASHYYYSGSIIGDSMYSSLSYNNSLSDNLSFGSSVSYNKYNGHETNSGNVSLSFNNSHMTSYGQLSYSNNKMSYSADFNTNLMATIKDNILDYTFTKDLYSDSLMVINSSKQLTENKANNIKITNVENNYSQTIPFKEQLFVPLSGYQRQKVNLNLVENNYYVNNFDSINGSSYDFIPGKVKILNINARNASQLFVVAPNRADELECYGSGCVKSNAVTSGIKKFIVKPDMPFKILINKKTCYTGSLKEKTTKSVVCKE